MINISLIEWVEEFKIKHHIPLIFCLAIHFAFENYLWKNLVNVRYFAMIRELLNSSLRNV